VEAEFALFSLVAEEANPCIVVLPSTREMQLIGFPKKWHNGVKYCQRF